MIKIIIIFGGRFPELMLERFIFDVREKKRKTCNIKIDVTDIKKKKTQNA